MKTTNDKNAIGLNGSVMSFPERGVWGNSKWRGNASGHVYRSLFEQLQPAVFIDPMVGSGTSVEVAREMGIEAYGLDLYQGFNAVDMSILQATGKQADLVVSHPPYGSMIRYSGPGGMWGDAPHPADLSHCTDDEQFLQKMQAVLLNQRCATLPDGYYGTLIGDWRRNGIYTSYQAELIARMPRKELAAVLIKTQHNCVSDGKNYGRLKLPRIQHEYLLLWQKKAAPVVVVLSNLVREQADRMAGTWKSIVRVILVALGGTATLTRLYAAIARGAQDKLASNPHWKAKVRQTLNQNSDIFRALDQGIWSIAS